jgi:hypothetical protein
MKSLHVSMLSGHTTGIKKYYYIPKDAEVLEDFMINSHDALTIDDTQRLKQENQELKSTQAQEIAQQKQEIDMLKTQMRQMELKNLEMWKKSLVATLESMDRFTDDTQMLEIQNLISDYDKRGLDVSDLNKEFRRLRERGSNNR